MDDEKKNWLQHLVRLPFVGGWIGTLVFLVPAILALLGLLVVTEFLYKDARIDLHLDARSGGGWFLLLSGLVLGAWAFAVRWVMKVRLVMPVIPIPWWWIMAVFVVSGLLQLAGHSGEIRIGG